MRPFHRVVAIVACLVIPTFAWLRHRPTFAWAMFTGTATYRLRIVARDASGRSWFVAPTELARDAGQNAAVFFAGADHYRRIAGSHVVRAHLGEVARHACRIAPEAAAIEITLFERSADDQQPQATTAHASCR